MAGRTRHPGAQEFLPDSGDLAALADAAASCRGCDLYEQATQTVFGAGPGRARLMLVGEQPGDVEDTEGEPFVGPAGTLLREALEEAGLGRVPTYVTNAVKHFRFTRRGSGQRRIHEKPTAGHATACRPWLAAELNAVRPAVLVALGATAAGSLLGPGFRLTQHRGEALDWPPAGGPFRGDRTPVDSVLATLHPSAVLRGDPAEREQLRGGLVADLRLAASRLP